MKIKNNREYFLTLYRKLDYLGALKGAKFAFTISRNKQMIKPMVNKVNELAKMSELFKEFDKKRVEINEKYATKDENGKSIMKDERFEIPEDKKEDFEKEIEALKEEYKEAIKEREEQKNNVEAYLKEETELELKPIPLSMIPDDINVDEMEIIEPLVEE